MPGGGLEVKVDARDLTALYRATKALTAQPSQLQVELRRGIKKAAKPVADGVKSAAGFSSRIPGAVKTKVSFVANGAGVSVFVDSKAAPEAAPINNKGKGGQFRHPVYGNRDNWVSQTAVPFFDQGARAGAAAAEAAMLQVMDAIAAKLGFN